jgi:hypothetical protein
LWGRHMAIAPRSKSPACRNMRGGIRSAAGMGQDQGKILNNSNC